MPVQRHVQNSIYRLRTDKVELATHSLVNFLQVTLIVLGNHNRANPVPQGSHGLLLQAANPHNPAPKGNLTRHSNVPTDGNTGKGGNNCCAHRHTGRWAILGNRSFREMNMTGLDFCWAKDTGKYAAHQYFTVYAGQRIPRVAVGWDLKKRDLRKLGPDGGWLPRLGQVFSKWTQLSLPECYLKEDMPAGGIAYAYIPSSWSCCGLYQILVHKDVAQRLLQAKAVPASALKPVPVLDALPSDYTLRETSPYHRPTQEYMAQSLRDYEALKKKVRPTWVVTEKDALKLLRKAKKEGQLGKKLAKAKVEALAGTAYGPLLPYYLITGGGYLSDEYKLLTVPESQMETAGFYQALEKEELLAVKPQGLVICTCANGDKVLLLHDGTVIRFNHEAPEVCEQWQSLPQFIVDAINEC